MFWEGVGDIALGRRVASSAFISFPPFPALVYIPPMVFLLSSCFIGWLVGVWPWTPFVFLLRSCFIGWLVGVRPGTPLLGLGPGSRGVGRVRAADCPACLSGTRWLISYFGTAQPSCRLPAGRVCSGRAYRPPGLEHSRGSGVAALPPGPRRRPRPCCLPRLRWWSLVRCSGVLSPCHPSRWGLLGSVFCARSISLSDVFVSDAG